MTQPSIPKRAGHRGGKPASACLATLPWLFIISLYCNSLPAQSGTHVASMEGTAWLCWIAISAKPAILCALEVDQASPLTLEDADSNEMLDLLHIRFDDGASERELEGLFQLCSSCTGILTIPIYSNPYEISWREKRPQTLLRSLLCRDDSKCSVTLRKPKD